MAVPSYTTNLSLLSDADSGAFLEFTPYARGGTPVAETDFYIQGSACRSQSFGTKTGLSFSIVYDAGSNIASSFSAGYCFFIWQICLAGNAIDTYANGGYRVGIGASLSAISSWATGGSDYNRNPYGGWQNVVVDPTKTADYTDNGGNGGAYRYFGSILNTVARISRGNPHGVDVMRYGRGDIVVINGSAGDGYATFTGMATTNDNNSNRWGLFSLQNGVYLWKGLMTLGTTASLVEFVDSNKTIIIEDTPKTYLNFNKIEINNASSSATWNNITFKALGTTSPGQIYMIDNAKLTADGCLFQNMDVFSFQSNASITNSTFQSCSSITSGGGVFTGSKVLTSIVAANTSAMIWNQAVDPDGYLDGMTFSKGTNAHHAIEFGTSSPTSITLRDWVVTGFNASNSQNDSTFHIKRTTGTVTISIVNGTGNFSYRSDGATVNIVINPVTTKVVVRDNTGSLLANAVVLLYAADGAGDLPYNDSVSITRSGSVATVTHTAHGLATNQWVLITGATQEEYNGLHQITFIDSNSYSFTVSGTPATPATGTPVCRGVVIFGTTTGTGQLTDNRTFSTPQNVTGWVRKSTSSPYFVESSLSNNTIDNNNGLTINVQMIPDE